MMNLQTLKMSECCTKVPSHPNFFRDLNNLELLELVDVPWEKPPRTALFSMRRLRQLGISLTNSTIDPSRFFSRLSNLEIVVLDYLSEKPLDVSRLKFRSNKIRRISLSGNTLEGLNRGAITFGLRNTSALKELKMSDVKVKSSMVRKDFIFLKEKNVYSVFFLNLIA